MSRPDRDPRWDLERSLLADGALVLRADREAAPLVGEWLPHPWGAAPLAGSPAGVIEVRGGPPPRAEAADRPDLRLRSIDGWSTAAGEILLRDPTGRAGAALSSDRSIARVWVDSPAVGDAFQPEFFAILNLCVALLLPRAGRTLVHAGAVVTPGGGGLLLAGGTFSGKSTTCLNLMRLGWPYLSDDHVVLGRDPQGALRLEGMPRRFNLDLGYPSGTSTGSRRRVDPAAYASAPWTPAASLEWIAFPRVQADAPTQLLPLPRPEVLARLLAQSPWLLMDRRAAPAVLALLQEAAEMPAFELQLGLDSYQDPGVLPRTLDRIPGWAA